MHLTDERGTFGKTQQERSGVREGHHSRPCSSDTVKLCSLSSCSTVFSPATFVNSSQNKCTLVKCCSLGVIIPIKLFMTLNQWFGTKSQSTVALWSVQCWSFYSFYINERYAVTLQSHVNKQQWWCTQSSLFGAKRFALNAVAH